MTASGSTARNLAFASAIVVLTAITYWGSLDGEFVSDDLQAVRDNPLVQSLDATSVGKIFSSFDDANYMPLKVLSLAVDRAILGPEPFGFHLVNLLLHTGCALLVFSILIRLGFSSLAAMGVALLWSIHPLQVESVAWISERKNVLSGLFFFAAFRVYLEFSKRPRLVTYTVTLVLFALALLSKMSTVVLPALCLAYEWIYKGRFRRIDVFAVLPMAALGGAIVWYNLQGSPVHGGSFHGGSAVVTWLSSTVVVFRYLWHVIWPVELVPGYDVALRGSPFEPPVILSILGLMLLAVVVVALARRKRPEAFWVLWAAITLAPMLNIIPFRSMMQDRYMYLPLLGPLALMGIAFDSLVRPVHRWMFSVAFVGAAVACMGLTRDQVEIWSNPFTLWARTATSMPMESVGRSVAPLQREKMAYLEAALERDPDDPTLHNNLGNLNYHAGLLQEALVHYEEAHRLRPGEPHNLVNLGRLYLDLSRFDEARQALERAVELRPYSYSAWVELLRLNIAMKNPSGSRRAWDSCVRIRPEAATSAALRRERAALQRLER